MSIKYCVGVYLCDRAYGGSEEGGWWYDTGELIRPIQIFATEDKAYAYANGMNRRLDKTLNKGRREISSVLSEGRYYAEVHEQCLPSFYPTATPRYE